jgi:ferritin-like metal-binding protein YciE
MKNEVKAAPFATNGKKKAPSQNKVVTHEKLDEIFINGLKDIYWAEKALTKALPKMIKNAAAEELVTCLTKHLDETMEQITRLEKVFDSIDEKPVAKKCAAMEGLIKEAEEIMEECEAGGMRDAGIISAGQKVEHYEIATYGTLRAFAEILGHKEAARLLLKSLGEEKAADDKLTEVTSFVITIQEVDTEEDN